MAPRPKQKLLAKCSANQAALDRMAEKRAALASSDRYSFTLKRAMESLAAEPQEIASHAQALTLKYVGSAMAGIICPPVKERLLININNTSKNSKKRKQTTTNSAASSPADSVKSAGSSCSTATASAAAAAALGNNKNKRPRCTATTGIAQQQQQLATILEKPTAKEVAYQKAVHAAESWKQRQLGGLTWRVVLLIDNREQKSEHIQAKCQMSGIPCEERQLPIGDMAWIAQGLLLSTTTTTSVVVELMLGTIIERKTPEDLKSSLFGTRYWEQRLRLQHSGLPQVLFLIEGDYLSRDLSHCSADTLHTAIWETRLHLNFSIIHTAHMEETVMTLKRMHRRILQRTFPRAFQSREALPTFQEADASNQQQNARQRKSMEEEQGRRRRRRRQSLAEMTFDMDPIPPLGMERFISYQELKAKIERDREAGTKTVGNLHMAMMKQVASFSSKKCLAVTRAYPTAHRLLQAYHLAAAAEEESNHHGNKNTLMMMVSELSTHDPGKSARNRTIGTRSADELYIAYGMDDGDDNDKNVARVVGGSGTAVPTSAATPCHTSTAVPQPSSTVNGNLAVPAPRTAAVAEAMAWSDRAVATACSKGRDEFGDHQRAALAAICLSDLDRKPAATMNSSSGIDLSMDSTDDDDDEEQRCTNYKNKAPASCRRPTKKLLNTSIGSLLKSSDDESPFLPRKKQEASAAAPNNDMHALLISDTPTTRSTGKSPPIAAALRTDAAYLDSSSSDEEDETIGLSLSERIMQARKLQSSSTTAKTSSVGVALPNDVIEID